MFSYLQKVGQAFMLPVAMLPVAGILLGVGSADLAFIPEIIRTLMKESGGAVFSLLPLLFAVSTAIAFSKMDGVAGLATLVGYFVFLSALGVTATAIGFEENSLGSVLGVKTVDTGVLGGVVIGFVAAYIYNKYKDIQLPDYLGFFAGRRFVPIMTALVSMFVGIAFAFIWKPIGVGIDSVSHYAAYSNPLAAFTTYAFIERLLIPTGLHHIWNVPFFFQVGSFTTAAGDVVHGEIGRYLAGDPTAGNLAGSYLFKMYGLPAAAIAIALSAKKAKRKITFGIMISAAFTSFLTGITEPIEFSFLFVAPILYVVHAFLAALGYLIVIPLGIKHGTTFSHGLIDYILLYPLSTKGYLLPILGAGYALVYFTVFTFLIRVFNFKTPGREDDTAEGSQAEGSESKSTASNLEKGALLIKLHGGMENITNLDACITRLRIEVKNQDLVDEAGIKSLGAKGVIRVGKGVQSVFGAQAEKLRIAMEDASKK